MKAAPLDLSLGTLALRADGIGLFLGRDNLAPAMSDFVAGHLDRDGTVSWARTYDLDTSFADVPVYGYSKSKLGCYSGGFYPVVQFSVGRPF